MLFEYPNDFAVPVLFVYDLKPEYSDMYREETVRKDDELGDVPPGTAGSEEGILEGEKPLEGSTPEEPLEGEEPGTAGSEEGILEGEDEEKVKKIKKSSYRNEEINEIEERDKIIDSDTEDCLENESYKKIWDEIDKEYSYEETGRI